MTTAFLISDLKMDEGLRLHAYPDPLSGGEPWTIGYGNTGPDIGPNTIWTQQQAEDALAERVKDITASLTEQLSWFDGLDDMRQDVLANMAYNMGIAGLMKFRNTLACVEAGDWQGAHDGMLDSTWARQVPHRASRLAEQMLTGQHV